MSVIWSYRRARYPSQMSERPAATKSANAPKRTDIVGDKAMRKITGHAAIRTNVTALGSVRRFSDKRGACPASSGERFDDQLAHARRGLEPTNLTQVDGEEVEEERAFGLRCEGDHLSLGIGIHSRGYVLQVRRLATETGAIVDDLNSWSRARRS